MADIFVMVRSQDNYALTSMDGIPFTALLVQDGQVLAKEAVELIHADAGFDDLPIGHYAVVVAHERTEPQAAQTEITIQSDDEVIMVTLVYLEPERVLLRRHFSIEKKL